MKYDSTVLNHIVICNYWSSFACGKCLKFITSSGQQMKKHFLKCHGIKDVHKNTDSQGSKSSKLHSAVENLAASPKRTRRTRVTSSVMRRKVTSHVGQSPNPVAKLPLRSRSKRVCIIANAPCWVQAQKVVITRSQINVAKSHISPIRSHVTRCGSVCFQAQFLTVWLF